MRWVGAILFLLAWLAQPALAESTRLSVVESKFELFVHDAEASVGFYTLLGFQVAHTQSYGYTTLRSGGTVVALSPLPGWAPVHWFGFLRYPPLGTELVFYTDDLERSREVLLASGHSPGEIALQSWGDRDFRVRDPDGYYVRVTEGAAVPVEPASSVDVEGSADRGPRVEIEGAWLLASQGEDESLQTLRVAIWARHVLFDPALPLATSGFFQLDEDPEREYAVASRGTGTGPWYRLQVLDFRPGGIAVWSAASAGAPVVGDGVLRLGTLPEGYQGAGSEPEMRDYRLTEHGLVAE